LLRCHYLFSHEGMILKFLLIWFCRQHFLQFPQGLLNKHFEKLIQCDMRLNFLSRQPEINLNSPYFEQRPPVFEDLDDSKCQDFNQVESAKVSVVSGFHHLASPSAAQSSSLEIDKEDPFASTSDHMSREAPSPSSGIMMSWICFQHVLKMMSFMVVFIQVIYKLSGHIPVVVLQWPITQC